MVVVMNYHTKLKEIVVKASTKIALIDEVVMSQKPAPNKWSKKEILGHLIDSAYNNHARFLKAGFQNNLFFEGYDQDEWVKQNNYQSRSAASILSLWQQSNEHISILIEGLPEDLLLRKTKEHYFDKMCMQLLSKSVEANLAYLIWDYIYHIEYHLNQIIEDYEMVNEPFLH